MVKPEKERLAIVKKAKSPTSKPSNPFYSPQQIMGGKPLKEKLPMRASRRSPSKSPKRFASPIQTRKSALVPNMPPPLQPKLTKSRLSPRARSPSLPMSPRQKTLSINKLAEKIRQLEI
jgi:hypothetical protein